MGDFAVRFFLCNIVAAIILALILIITKIMKQHITPVSGYRISLVSLLTLLVPFVPISFSKVNALITWFSGLGLSGTAISDTSISGPTGEVPQNSNWLEDFSLTLTKSSPDTIGHVLFAIWIIGALVLLIATLYSNRKFLKIKSGMEKPDEKLYCLLSNCKRDLGYGKKVLLGTSAQVKSPMTFGFFRPVIVVPEKFDQRSDDEIRCVLLHELSHLKHNHILANYFICLCRIVYWFNPVVWYFLAEVKTAIEVACDNQVLKALDSGLIRKYGEVIIGCASSRGSALIASNSISSSYKQVKKRIVSIAGFESESGFMKVKSGLILAVTAAIVLFSIPSMSVFAIGTDIYSFSGTNITYEDYSADFGDYGGSFVLYDSNAEKYTIYNEDESVTRISPYSTYKIYDALIALETGTISRGDSQLLWDGTEYTYEAWNQNHDLFTAMDSSVSWYFQALDKQMGLKTLQDYYTQIGYGNCDLSGGISDYWMGYSLKISPVEQVQLLEKLYNNEFRFDKENIRTVKDAIFLEQANGLSLYGKTGTGMANSDSGDGWFIGFVETDDNVYYFAAHIQGGNAAGSTAAEAALSILENKGIYY